MIKSNDYLDFNYGSYGNKFKNILAEKYNVTQDCGKLYENKGCILLESDNTFSYYKSLTNNTLKQSYFDDAGFITFDGILFLIEQGSQARDETGYIVTTDVNGYKKKPNKMGYDLFMFQITEDGDVLPMGADNTYWSDNKQALCSKSSTEPYNGYTCAYYAATDNDYFKKL